MLCFYRGVEVRAWGIRTLGFVWKDLACKGDEDYVHECEFEETNTCDTSIISLVQCEVPFRNTQSEGKVPSLFLCMLGIVKHLNLTGTFIWLCLW